MGSAGKVRVVLQVKFARSKIRDEIGLKVTIGRMLPGGDIVTEEIVHSCGLNQLPWVLLIESNR